ncbi:MAG: hypothetical protein Kow0080_14590 [Candidatus Promineifilaceae bacterium]
MSSLVRLLPQPTIERPLTGTYLAHNLRHQQRNALPFIYANFVTSLDGRIAIPRADGSGLTVPKAIANERDWRLFQELAAQADLIISSGRYLREWAEGKAQEILQVDDPRFADLRAWRQELGLPTQPDIAIISGSLNFPVPDILTANGRSFTVFTHTQADRQKIQAIEARSGRVVFAGDETIDGHLLAQKMGALGYRTIYSAAGPRILHLLAVGGVLNRLYLTLANRLLGGNPFSSILEGALLETAVSFHLHTLYHDPHGLNGLGQLFLSYNAVKDD